MYGPWTRVCMYVMWADHRAFLAELIDLYDYMRAKLKPYEAGAMSRRLSLYSSAEETLSAVFYMPS